MRTGILAAIGGSALTVGLVGAELGLRAAASKLNLRDWPNWEMENKTRAMDRLAKRGGASVVTIGSSMIQAAVDPNLLSSLMAGKRPTFNAALNGASARTIELWARHVIVPRLRPDLVILGFNSAELNDHSPVMQRIHDQFRSGRPWRRFADEGSIKRRVLFRLEGVSYLVRYRRYRRKDVRVSAGVNRELAEVSDLGYVRGVDLFAWATYGLRERQLKIWKETLHDYHPGGEEFAAIARLVDGLRAAGVAVLLVRMPITQDWIGLHPKGKEDYERFERSLDAFLRGCDVAFIDLTPEFTSLDDFVDPVHLSPVGRQKLTQRLAQLAADPALVRAN